MLPDSFCCNLSSEEIEDYVAEVRKIGYNGDINAFTAKIGGKITLLNKDDHLILLEVKGKDNFEVKVLHYTSPYKDQMFISRALGHYYLHAQQSKEIKVSYFESERLTWEANIFAMELLMPRKEFIETFNPDKPISSAAKFNVSLELTNLRAKQLKIDKSATFNRIYP